MHKKNHSSIPEVEQNQWFQTWFNTPFYHLLYSKRDYKEAEAFISKLVKYLNPPPKSKVLDLACGAGRHAITLNKFGLNVVGTDLSKKSIVEAKKHENESLHFEVHDMRDLFLPDYFDYIFNLFTSFGYFENLIDDEKVLCTCHSQLKRRGIMVLDYINVEKIFQEMPYKGVESRAEIDFFIEKKISGKHILKSIDFSYEGNSFHFEEKVALYTLSDFEKMFENCGFKISEVFGNYALGKYQSDSERVIIIAEKNHNE